MKEEEKQGKKIQILLSAYNGESYLREQMDSLLKQTWPDLEILVRDDGSTDQTSVILQEYERQYANVKVFSEENIGLVDSFFRLLDWSDADYIAFCDQDDVWMEQKVERAVAALERVQGPAMYCGNKMLVDAQLREIGSSDQGGIRPGFGNALIENIATGCTMLLNRELTEKIKGHIPRKAILHDWWCYLVASYYGTVVYDSTPYIYYRQHGNNQVGGSAGLMDEIAAKRQYLQKSHGRLKAQLLEFHRLHHGNEKKDRLLMKVLETETFGGKMNIIFQSEIYRQKKMDNFIVRGLFFMNHML